MIKTLFVVFTLIFSSSLLAQADDDGIQAVTANLQKLMPHLPIDSITATPIKGLYELVSSNRIYYVNKNGRYLLDGSLIDIVNNKNLTKVTEAKLEVKNKVVRVKQLKTLSKDEMLIYPAKGKTKHFMSVFTDVSCPFCAKLHKEVPELNANGVEVRYMLYPRDYSRVGIRSRSFQTMVSAWCADNPQQALTDSINNKDIAHKSCDHPMLKHIELANKMGLSGTPMIILDDGTLVEGYRPAKALLKAFK